MVRRSRQNQASWLDRQYLRIEPKEDDGNILKGNRLHIRSTELRMFNIQEDHI